MSCQIKAKSTQAEEKLEQIYEHAKVKYRFLENPGTNSTLMSARLWASDASFSHVLLWRHRTQTKITLITE